MGTMKDAAKLLSQWDKLLLLSHASPDGDTLGSATALMRGLRQLGKRVQFACSDKIGSKYEYLFENLPVDSFVPEKIVTVDVADDLLLGSLREQYLGKIDLAIDHHASRVKFSRESWVDSKAASTTLMIFELLTEMAVTLTTDIADCLYTGLTTDTGCFRFSNANARAYRAAADLIEAGAHGSRINRMMFDTKTRACIEVERRVLADMEFLADGKIVCASIPRVLLEETKAEESDLEGIPSMVRGIEGVLIGITLKEKADGLWKASVRAVSPVNASQICQTLGGGGHKGAAGCSLGTNFAAAKASLLAACQAHLEGIEGK